MHWVSGFFPRGKTLTTNPPSSAEVKERVELYLNSPAGRSWYVLERNSTVNKRETDVGGMTCHKMTKHKNGHQNKGFDRRSRLFRKLLFFFGTVYDVTTFLQLSRAVIPNRGSAVPWGTANTS